ncbi:MAG: hypothetical protein U9R44_04220 [Candidatus Omnitrophota bacterium]|nr:hypothetical protein [Candidatus Omnitrophota bacterium]
MKNGRTILILVVFLVAFLVFSGVVAQADVIWYWTRESGDWAGGTCKITVAEGWQTIGVTDSVNMPQEVEQDYPWCGGPGFYGWGGSPFIMSTGSDKYAEDWSEGTALMINLGGIGYGEGTIGASAPGNPVPEVPPYAFLAIPVLFLAARRREIWGWVLGIKT